MSFVLFCFVLFFVFHSRTAHTERVLSNTDMTKEMSWSVLELSDFGVLLNYL